MMPERWLSSARLKSPWACSRAARAESSWLWLAESAAAEPASSAAARVLSIWRRKSPALTGSPSRTARLTTWPMTRAARSTFFSAWILPLAVTLATTSSSATLATDTSVGACFFW